MTNGQNHSVTAGRLLLVAAAVVCLLAQPVERLLRERYSLPYRPEISIPFYVVVWSIGVAAKCFLTAWIALGPERFRERLLRGWGAMVVGGALLVAAGRWVEMEWTTCRELFGFELWVALLLQIPLWILRYGLQCRLSAPDAVATREQWSFKDWALGLVICGGVLSLSRPLFATSPEGDFMLSSGIFAGVAQIFLLPAIFYVFRVDRPSHVHGWFVVHSLVLLVPLGVFFYYYHRFMAFRLGEVVWTVSTALIGVYGGLWALRLAGYRLMRCREEAWLERAPASSKS